MTEDSLSHIFNEHGYSWNGPYNYINSIEGRGARIYYKSSTKLVVIITSIGVDSKRIDNYYQLFEELDKFPRSMKVR